MANRELRKKQITEQREEQILKAALEVFAHKGYGAASIPEIAGKAGVAVGTIYNYYAGKRELFIAVMRNLIITDPLLDMSIKDNVTESDIIDMLKQIIQNRLQLMETESGTRIPYLMSEIVRDPELKVLWVEQSIQPFFTRMESVYGSVMVSGKLRHMDTELAVRVVAGLIIGFSLLRFLEGEKSPALRLSQEGLIHALLDFVLHGLALDTEG